MYVEGKRSLITNMKHSRGIMQAEQGLPLAAVWGLFFVCLTPGCKGCSLFSLPKASKTIEPSAVERGDIKSEQKLHT